MTDYEQAPDFEDEEEDEELKVYTEGYGREHIVFLVDAAENMFTDKLEIEEGKAASSFSIAMDTISDFVKKRIVSGGKDEFAVIFYNTAKSENSLQQKHVYVHVPRDLPDANMVLKIASLYDGKFQRIIGTVKAEEGEGPEEMKVKQCVALKSGLWTAMDTLTTRGSSKNARHRIILFSNTEDPCQGLDPSYKMQIMERVMNLKDIGSTLRFFPLVSCKRPFRLGLFWQKVLDELQDPEDELANNPVTQTQFTQVTQGPLSPSDVRTRLLCLGEYMKRCLQQRRVMGTVRWTLSHDMQISLQVYALFVEAKKPWTVKLRASDNAALESKSVLLSEDTGLILPFTKVDKKQLISDKAKGRFPRVVFTVDELSAIKHYEGPGMRLIGFKPRAMLQEHHNITHSSFLRPTEKDIKGSTAVFKGLLDSMARKDVVAVCAYARTKRSEPCLVALMPEREELDEQGYQVWAEGMFLIRLPFKDDIRTPESNHNEVGTQFAQVTDYLIDVASTLVSSLQCTDFSLGGVSNPALDRHFQVIEALALNEQPPDKEDFIDSTLPPDPETVKETAGEQLTAFEQAMGLVDVDGNPVGAKSPVKTSAGTKRKAGGEDLSVSEAYTHYDWAKLKKDMQLKKLTLPDLKVYLQYHNLKLSGNKGDIVDRIERHIEAQEARGG